jgi:hypothetical protein
MSGQAVHSYGSTPSLSTISQHSLHERLIHSVEPTTHLKEDARVACLDDLVDEGFPINQSCDGGLRTTSTAPKASGSPFGEPTSRMIHEAVRSGSLGLWASLWFGRSYPRLRFHCCRHLPNSTLSLNLSCNDLPS